MEAPSYSGAGNPVTQRSNREQGIREGARVLAPRVFHDDKSCSRALDALCKDHELQLSVPSRDGLDWAGWYVVDVARDVLRQAAADCNLRAVPANGLRRLQIIFDAHGWTSASGATRFLLRCPDTLFSHNAWRYGRDQSFYVGKDKHCNLSIAVMMGGARSLFNTLLSGMAVSTVAVPLAEELQKTRSATDGDAEVYGEALHELLSIRWVAAVGGGEDLYRILLELLPLISHCPGHAYAPRSGRAGRPGRASSPARRPEFRRRGRRHDEFMKPLKCYY
eukprot:7382047-Prymnesium_polylepis.1